MTTTELLTADQVASILGVTAATVRKLTRDGKLKGIAIGNGPRPMRRYTQADLDAFLESARA